MRGSATALPLVVLYQAALVFFVPAALDKEEGATLSGGASVAAGCAADKKFKKTCISHPVAPLGAKLFEDEVDF